MQSWLVSGTREVLKHAASLGGGFFLGALGSLLAFAIMLFLLFFFLRDGDAMLARARRLDSLERRAQGAAVPAIERRDARHRRRHQRDGAIAGSIDRHRFHRSPACLRRWCSACWRRCFPCCRWAGRLSSGVRRRSGCSSTAAGAMAFSCWAGDCCWAAWTMYCGPCSFPAGREFRRWPCSSACWAGFPAFGAIGIIAGPVVLSLVLALIEFAEESRPRGA